MTASYYFDDFITACKNNQVVVLQAAQATARVDFNLHTKNAVNEFICNNGLENPYHINTKPWKNNPDINCPIMVDAYSFHSGPIHGYIAFFFNPKTDKWLIKSLKTNIYPATRNNQMFEQLLPIKALMKKNEEI